MPLMPGVCTSTSATSGLCVRISRRPSSALPASPSTSISDWPDRIRRKSGTDELMVVHQHDADHGAPPLSPVQNLRRRERRCKPDADAGLTGIAAALSFPARAGIAQLVEHDLAKVGVASSSLVSRSIFCDRP